MQSALDEHTKIPMLEPYTVKKMVSALSETEDYNHRMLNIPEMWKRSRGASCVCNEDYRARPDEL